MQSRSATDGQYQICQIRRVAILIASGESGSAASASRRVRNSPHFEGTPPFSSTFVKEPVLKVSILWKAVLEEASLLICLAVLQSNGDEGDASLLSAGQRDPKLGSGAQRVPEVRS